MDIETCTQTNHPYACNPLHKHTALLKSLPQESVKQSERNTVLNFNTLKQYATVVAVSP